MEKYKFTIGADPEFFVLDKKEGSVVPSCRKFGGEKRAPMFLSPDGGFLEDGATLEFNVTPSKTLQETKKKIENLLLVFLNKYDQYAISKYSHATFDEATLKEFPEAMQIGCSPDLFAYGLRIAPSIEKFKTTRFAGGHVHLGIDPWPEGLEKDVVVKFLDLLFVCPVIHRFVDAHRYPFYGHPGLYRETNYGVEHRSPDNWWCNSALFSSVGGDTRDYMEGVISNFDDSIRYLKSCLNFDEHGARVNHDLRKYIKETRIEDKMCVMEGILDSNCLRNYRGYGSETHSFTRREWGAREMIIMNRASVAHRTSAAG